MIVCSARPLTWPVIRWRNPKRDGRAPACLPCQIPIARVGQGHFLNGDHIGGPQVAEDATIADLAITFAGEYGDERDTGGYVASAFDDGPFLAMIFLGASGLGEITFLALVAAVVPFILGLIVGAVDREWTHVLDDVPIPFMSFAVGTGISLEPC